METIDKKVEVNVSLQTAYNQWTQFEEFPHFIDDVKLVRQLDDNHLLWEVSVFGKTKEWQAEITEQVPDSKIAWKSTSGFENCGEVRFRELEPCATEISVHLEYQPESLLEGVADKMGVVSHEVQGALEKFKSYIESRGRETGAWRGQI